MEPNTPIGETQQIFVARPNGQTPAVEFVRRDGGWYVKTPADDEFWKFATEGARRFDVVELINKKWCESYSVDPDEFTDRS